MSYDGVPRARRARVVPVLQDHSLVCRANFGGRKTLPSSRQRHITEQSCGLQASVGGRLRLKRWFGEAEDSGYGTEADLTAHKKARHLEDTGLLRSD